MCPLIVEQDLVNSRHSITICWMKGRKLNFDMLGNILRMLVPVIHCMLKSKGDG